MTENDRNDDTTPRSGGTPNPPPYVPPPGPGDQGGSPPAQGQPGPGGSQPTRPMPAGQPGTGPQQARGGKRPGQVRQQRPGVTQARPPTVAEQRARQIALKQQEEQRLAAEAEEERRRKKRKRLLIGGGVTAGVVGVVAIWYAVSSPDDVEAQCTRDGVVVEDQYCDESYARSHGGYSSGGFIYIGGSSYRYHYGGASVPVGQKVSGGSYTVPKGANITTKSGKTIQRGGFGVSGSSKSGGS